MTLFLRKNKQTTYLKENIVLDTCIIVCGVIMSYVDKQFSAPSFDASMLLGSSVSETLSVGTLLVLIYYFTLK